MANPVAADIVLRNGKIATLDSQDRFVSAVAAWNGRIIAAGSLPGRSPWKVGQLATFL